MLMCQREHMNSSPSLKEQKIFLPSSHARHHNYIFLHLEAKSLSPSAGVKTSYTKQRTAALQVTGSSHPTPIPCMSTQGSLSTQGLGVALQQPSVKVVSSTRKYFLLGQLYCARNLMSTQDSLNTFYIPIDTSVFLQTLEIFSH